MVQKVELLRAGAADPPLLASPLSAESTDVHGHACLSVWILLYREERVK